MIVQFQQTVVGDHNQGIHVVFETGNSFIRVLAASGGFEGEGLADHAHRQRAGLFCNLRHDWGGAGAGATAHSHGQENHVRAFNSFLNVLAAFLGGLASQIRVSARAQPPGQVLSNGYSVGNITTEKVLRVGVHRVVFDRRQLFLVHPTDCVAATAAYPDHLDYWDSPTDLGHHV